MSAGLVISNGPDKFLFAEKNPFRESLHDKSFGEFFQVLHEHWDQTERRLIRRGGEANVVFRNRAYNGGTMTLAYKARLIAVGEEVHRVKAILQSHLSQ